MQRKIIALLVVALVVTGIIFLGRGRASRTDDGNHLPADSASMKTVKPTVRIFMENSGSMNGFVTINSEFKNALGHLIAKTNGFYEGTKLFFINDAVHHAAVCDNLNDFVLHLNPQTMQVGNTGSTDITKIFGMILDRTKNDTVSILVSDCVYDVDNVGNLLSAASSSTTGTFMKAIRQAKEKNSDFAVILMQCESKFYGYHYEGNMPMVCNGIRPYYVIIMGKKEAVLELDEHLELENTPTGLPGLTHKFMISSEDTWDLNHQTARVFTNGFTNALRIQPEHDGLNIRNIITDHDKLDLTFSFGLGVQNLFVARDYLLDKDNYEVEPEQYYLEQVTDQAKFTECDYFDHPICVQIKTEDKSFAPEVTVRLKNQIPAWVKKCSYNTRMMTLPSQHKSYALYEMVEGIYGAFYNARDRKNKDLFRLKVKVANYE